MLKHGPVAPASHEDTNSFLIPAFGFSSHEEAESYKWESTLSGSYTPMIGGGKTYVPRADPNFCNWHVTRAFSPSAITTNSNKPSWETLRKNSDPKPSSAYNVALLVAGKREFYLDGPSRRSRNPWHETLVSGHRDCFTAWCKPNFSDFTTNISGETVEVYAARGGKGAIYAEVADFDHTGKQRGIRSFLTLVEFSIFDRDPQRDDSLKVTFVWCTSQYSGKMALSDAGRLDEGWMRLARKAQEGFARECKAFPAELAEWWDWFKPQIDKQATDYQLGSSSFWTRTQKMHWQDALRLVQEPSQLKVVVGHHGTRPEFSSDGGVYCIMYETVPEMLKRHECDDARRAELFHMMEEYVRPTSPMWNYRGD